MARASRHVSGLVMDAFTTDAPALLLDAIRDIENPNFRLQGVPMPAVLENAPAAGIAAAMGAVECFRVFVNLSVNHRERNWNSGEFLTHFASMGGVFDICRELDNLGSDWELKKYDGLYGVCGSKRPPGDPAVDVGTGRSPLEFGRGRGAADSHDGREGRARGRGENFFWPKRACRPPWMKPSGRRQKAATGTCLRSSCPWRPRKRSMR
jgi:hypothetical protein